MLEQIITTTKRIKLLAIKRISKTKNSVNVTEQVFNGLIFIPDICGNYKPQSVANERVALMNAEIGGPTFSKRYKYKETKRLEFVIAFMPENILDYVVTSKGTFVKVILYGTR